MKLFVLALLFVSCNNERAKGPVVNDTKKASVDKAEMLRAEIKMSAGELTIEGGGKGEVRGDFRYTSGGMVPEFRFDNTSFRARLVIEESSKEGMSGQLNENTWKIKLADGLPTDLSVNMGAGEAKLLIGSMDLRSVSLNIGAGEVVADFLGEPTRDYEVKIRGGVGECKVTLPKSVGIRADVQGGIGSVEVEGLDKRDSAYENDLFSKNGPKIRLSAQGGVGRIHIVTR